MNPTPRLAATVVAVAVTLTVLAFAASASAPSTPADDAKLRQLAGLVFQPLPAPPAVAPGTPEAARIALGRQLYFDPRLSKEGNVSCNSCHDLASYGVDNLAFSPGDDGRLGGRNSPTVLNAALHVAQFWDGRASDVEDQAGKPVLNPVEMAIPDESFLVERLGAVPEYRTAFAAAFPGEDPALTYENLGRAIGAFERTLITPSRFDVWLRGDDAALDERERAGLDRFFSAGCAVCHDGATVGARTFRRFGLRDDYWTRTGSPHPDEGRFAETGDPADRYVFKVAALRNVARTAPYFHDGSVATLEEAVRVMADLQTGVSLTDPEVGEILAFLETLTGEVPPSAFPENETSGGG